MVKKNPPRLTADQKQAILLLRYRTTRPERTAPSYLALKPISTILHLPFNQVKRVCQRTTLKKKVRKSKVQLARQLQEEHDSFLTAPATLKLWAGKTLLQRSILFHRHFPAKFISATSLCRLYKKHKIKRKVITRFKGATEDKIMEMLQW